MAQHSGGIESRWGAAGPFSANVSAGASHAPTIAFLDVVGYSAMMARDEAGTHTLWMSDLNQVIKPAIASHGGQLVKSTGDGVHVVFAQPDPAVQWALDVQQRTGCAGTSRETTLRIALRISIHRGPVIWEADDVYGDAVNVAARLQQYAPPGGIIVSQAAFDALDERDDLPVRNLGALSLRNIDTPVRAFLLRCNDLELPAGMATRMGALPSIAVLPFDNPDPSPADRYFTDGIVEDIIVSLARLRELLVISRAATLVFGRGPSDPREVGASLGVRYALAGSLRRTPGGLLISAQLVDTHNGETLWTERFSSPPEGIFDVQDEIVARVVAGIAPTVQRREMRQALRKRPDAYSAYDYTLRALEIISQLDVDTFQGARNYLDRAIAEDGGFAMAYAWAARWHSIQIGQGWSADAAKDASEAVRNAKRAIELDPDNAMALATFGHLQSFLFRNYDVARVYLARARETSPCSAFAWIVSSATESYLGEGREAVRMAERGLRLSPKGYELFFFYNFLSLAHYTQGSYDEALKWAQISDLEHPLYTSNLRMLCACLAAVGRVEEAREAGERLLQVEAGFSLQHYARERQPFKAPDLRNRFLDHLRQAGLPG